MRASRFLKSQRAKRSGRRFSISAFSIFLVGFGLLYFTLHLFTLLPNYECRYGLIWISGWFENYSLFHVTAASVGLVALLFVIRLVCLRSNLNVAETVFQAALVGALILVLLTQKAFFFPYGSPSWAQFERIAGVVFPTAPRLVEEADLIFDPRFDWKYDYPPPVVEFTEDPRWSDKYNRRVSTIFQDKNSPLWREYRVLLQCDAEMVEALEQWKRDEETLEQYWKDFREWYAVNRWQYEE
ncbi:MAG: hypothetical protein AAFX54_03810 [Pseudomonadota bacterium]